MSEMPDWMEGLVEAVAAGMTAYGPAGPLGLRFREEHHLWDVQIYPLHVEMVGGAQDGGVVYPNFTLDLGELRNAFERLDAFAWEAHGIHGDDGPCLLVRGSFRGHNLELRILAYAPEGIGPGAKVNAAEMA